MSVDVTISLMQTVPRLINQFKPKSYELSLKIQRKQRTFSGLVVISGKVKSKNNKIQLHSKNLEIESVTFDGKSADFKLERDDLLTIEHSNLTVGKHIFVIKFNGLINDSMHGIYPCYYEHKGIRKELLATQFESHHAREVFPCVDEPEAKATFKVTLDTDVEPVVLGNMPIKKQYTDKDRLITNFEDTPIMSSYLLAWVIGDLHKKTTTTNSGVEVNVWATPNNSSESLDFALDIAKKSIEFFDEYFQTPYPLPKCNHVALPDFASGAMENWGLITYREIALLADPKTTSIESKRYIATVIAHELSHQWFGNLVTMKWWDDLWLNESFASLIEYTAIDAIKPEWNVWMDFASFDTVIAFRRDSLAGVQPVKVDVNHPDEIGTLFDGAIVYAKGAHLLQMLQTLIGEDKFRQGLKEYFKTFAYKNTEANDLWKVFSQVSEINVGEFMDKWLTQPNFPVLNVSYSDNKLSISQNSINEEGKSNWPIFLSSNNKTLPSIFENKKADFDLDNKDFKKLRFNMDGRSHFITNYDDMIMGDIFKDLDNNKIPPIGRLQLINELVLLANNGITSSVNIIKALRHFKNETSDQVWDLISIAISELKKFTEQNEKADKQLRKLVGDLVETQYQRLGWNKSNNETEEDTRLRSTILSLALYAKNKDATDKVCHLYKKKQLADLDPDIRNVILSGAVKYAADRNIIDDLLKKYQATDSGELKQSLVYGLTSVQNKEDADKILGLLKDKQFVRTQDLFRWLAYLIRNKHSRTTTWDWIRQNWQWIEDTFSGDKSYDEYPKFIASSLNTKEQLEQYHNFFTPLSKDPALKRAVAIGINEIAKKVRLIEKDGQKVISELLNL